MWLLLFRDLDLWLNLACICWWIDDGTLYNYSNIQVYETTALSFEILTLFYLKQGAVELRVLRSWAVTWSEARPHHPRPASWGHKQNLGNYCLKGENMSLLQHVTCIRVPTDMVLMSLMLGTGCSQDLSAATYLYLIWCFNALRPLTQYQAVSSLYCVPYYYDYDGVMVFSAICCSNSIYVDCNSWTLLTLPVSCGCTWIVANQSFKSYY